MLPAESVKLAQQQEEILRILRDPRFRGQFTISTHPNQFWESLISFISKNSIVFIKFIEELTEKELRPLREEIEHLRTVTERYRKGTMKRDLEIIKLHREGKSTRKIARIVGLTRPGVSKVLRRLGLSNVG
jgi:hypothetical protein